MHAMFLRISAILLSLLLTATAADAASKTGRPNILLIVADDLGYADLGVFGGDIETPTIDALAEQGVLFTQFHTAVFCSPTRAMLLSGNNNHIAGVGRQGSLGLAGRPVTGYEAGLSDRIAPLPKLLRDAGYHTYTVGKWHLGTRESQWPRAAGFERSFTLLYGGGSYFDNRSFRPGGSKFVADGQSVEYPVGEYATTVYTDKLIEFIEADKNDEKPFFIYAAYTAPHWPLQVPDDYLDLYSGQYDDGYDVLRARRMDSLKEAGIIPLDAELPPRNDNITPWEDLDDEQKRKEARKMELYASLLDNFDDHIGRLTDYLKAEGLFDNTLIVFMSDNGAAGEDFYNDDNWPEYKAESRKNFDNAYELMGTADSFVSYGPQWAEAGSAPFRRHKGYATQGGIVAPMFVTGPGIEVAAHFNGSYVTVMDIAPTLLEVAGATYPDDGSVEPMLGESMVGLLAGRDDRVHDDDYITVFSHRGRAFVRQGDWKIVTLNGPFDEADFELFNIADDPDETEDLRFSEPEKFEELLDIWREKRREYGIIVPRDL
jgi:arylsulfatase A-like enzyme